MKKVLTLLSLTVALCLIIAGSAGAGRYGSRRHGGALQTTGSRFPFSLNSIKCLRPCVCRKYLSEVESTARP
jgi:hypothetical protein